MHLKAAATDIARRLQEAGHTAYFAGGCVRDELLGHQPHDYDIATSAKPAEVRKLFPHTQAVGAHFGVILVMEHGRAFEVATFRSDHEYLDGRRP
ncbi:MAG: CCA tRNA nucleotidyltransferase, partial [Chthoniobacterales bacterium]|nr:CCA tRNA nucleotidyltransferase [Chthoniobacterales bacterium]